MSSFETLRRQVAIGGITRSGVRVTSGCVIELLHDGEPNVKARKTSRNDGLFYFMDLPEGKYLVRASVKGNAVSGSASVARTPDGRLPAAWLDLQLEHPATAG